MRLHTRSQMGLDGYMTAQSLFEVLVWSKPGNVISQSSLMSAVQAAVTSVDISASARELTAMRSLRNLRVSNAYRYCLKGNRLAIIREGIPDEGSP